ncbi:MULTISPECIES: HlyD family secretion protein [unclassified Legionella]|uniref:HlyD family secretion protein n=1 Tax=unclassified Legionella TaxID=2622702 RepID=UPI0013EF7A1A|nr:MULTISPECIES: HlyD family efflux transporter periplasmic adaptor subunit [unclassified Legionella]MDI9818508.1 HlyD family efflux transporter periplasmic adaptor subunit [Legionella sp. PL877]
MENKYPLFRQNVINNRIHRSLGVVRINIPLNYSVAGYIAVALVFVLLLFFSFAQISERTLVRGFLDTENGIISVESNASGLVEKIFVEEGSEVKKGDVLFIISNPVSSNNEIQLNNHKQRILNLKREYQIKDEHYQALTKLYEKKYVSFSSLKEAESERLEFQNKVKMAEYELLQFKENQTQQITASSDGTVTNIFYRRGQKVQSSKPLLQIIPSQVNLIVRLYIPSREIGFLKKNQKINLKYDAYPSQRFGFYEAAIKEINQTILTDEKEDKPIHIGEPYYKIKAELKEPYVLAYGKKVKLNHGMTLSAIITGEKKSIWQWVLDPLYSYYGEQVI